MYVPPLRGRMAASWAEDRALHRATKAAIRSEMIREGPAIPAAGAIIAKIPAPRMAASPVETASNKLSCGRSVSPFEGDDSPAVEIPPSNLRLFLGEHKKTGDSTVKALPKAKRDLKTGEIKQTVLIPNSTPTQVYRALLSSKVHSEFTGSPASVSARAGAKFNAWDGYISGKNVELQDSKKIVQDWQTTEWP